MDISRRKLATALTSVFVGVAGTGMAAGQAPPQSSDTELESARSLQRTAAETIARVPLPMTIEPAVQFKA